MGRYDQYSDEELIVRLREGETEISDYLMEKYKEFVNKQDNINYQKNVI